ncbi:VanZ family protein [uncultured Algibacter sp.]|uniref:VanZ family protein n=1 Tax=uncultured Algibacter sp. TaxID=298659 RepID=UPI0030EB5CAD
MLKKVTFLVALGYSVALGAVSLITLDIPNVQISFADKIFHFLAYSLFTVLWYLAFFYTFSFKKRKSIIYAAVLAILFGIVIEVLQDTITTSRTLDVYDALANTFGALVTTMIIGIKNSLYVKNS